MGASVARAEESPPWLREILARPAQPIVGSPEAQVLEIERHVKLTPAGRMTETEHGAVKILRREGARAALAEVPYRIDSGKVRDLKAWLVSPAGTVTRVPPTREVDVSQLQGLYEEARVRGLAASSEAIAGCVFAYQWTREQLEPYAQFDWAFQGKFPTLLSRFVLELPAGWTATSLALNGARRDPQIASNQLVWELRDLPQVLDEPRSLPTESLVPRIVVNARPPAGHSENGVSSFSSWNDVARWLHGISGPMAQPDERVRTQARRLVAHARTELDTLRALGRFVQSVRYAAIQMGLSRGGGYRPRPPDKVLGLGYGDCKDKANLLRSMLLALDRRAFLLTMRVDDPGYVQEEWPSPEPFNHCIVALPIRASYGLPAEVADPARGRLLIFDPSDMSTPFGEVPDYVRGGLGLVISDSERALLRLPLPPPEASRLERRLELTLDNDGSASCRLIERAVGEEAAHERALLWQLGDAEYGELVRRRVALGAPGAAVRTMEVQDDTLGGRLEIRMAFDVPRYAQVMQERLLILRPLLISRLGLTLRQDQPRHSPILLDRRAVRETLVVRIPAEFQVDELPEAVALEAPFATFGARTEAAGSDIVQTRTLTERSARVPSDQFVAVRDFYLKIGIAEEAPIVLTKP